jgi:signal transduction histidine kinase
MFPAPVESPATALRLLHVEDSEFDHELVRAQLAQAGVAADWTRVETEGQFEAALAQRWDAVICDHNLPGASGLQLLARLRRDDALLPFLLVSGEIGEDIAVQAMRAGASDYLLKGRLARLVPALQQAIKSAAAQRERERAVQALRRSREQLAELAGHLQERIEAERAQLSRELHDEVGSALTALKFDLAWLQRHAGSEALAARSSQAIATLDGAIEASRRLMLNLRPPILEEGLVPALQWLLQRFERSHEGVAIELQHPPEAPELPPALLLVAYRFVQEALHNISKHAQASRVRVELQWASGVLGVEVEDDGRGLSPEALEQPQRFGLRGLRERAASCGGWVDVSSRPGQGVLLALSLPLDGVAETATDFGAPTWWEEPQELPA